MNRPVLLLVIAILALAGGITWWAARGEPPPRRPISTGRAPAHSTPAECVECHRERNPGLVAQHESGAHAARGVGCHECHGTDHEAIFRAEGAVRDDACARCHEEETAEFRASTHYKARSAARSNARLMAQIPAMQRAGCLSCHDMGPDKGAPQGSTGRCNSCHGAHRFSVAEARRPETCGVCHCGPDHPHIEAWERSKHGASFLASRDADQAPTCVTCHMPGGRHSVSGGITLGDSGSGAVCTGESSPVPMHTIAPERAKEERAAMVAICVRCHSVRFASESLADADAIKREADRLVGEAVRVVSDLHREGLLVPDPSTRDPHPTAGHALVLGGAMLYEEQSEAERIFFDIAKFAHAITFKGAYHQSPDHTHWLGMARLKSGLTALHAEARRLRSLPRPP